MRSDTQVDGDERTAAVVSGDGESSTDAEDRPGRGTESEGGDADENDDLGAYPDTRLVDELVRRFESGDLAAETEQELRDRFDCGDSGPGDGLEQRIADLQRRVSDIEAFSRSVEAIHEQHGPPAEVLDETTAELADLAQTVDNLDERVDSLDTQGDDVESRISSVEADVESLQSSLSEIEARMDSAAAEREELASTVSDLVEWREQLVGSLTNQGGD
jgi:methyl-accepting chemotaxis protein